MNRFKLAIPLAIMAMGCSRIGDNNGSRSGSEDQGPIVVFSPDAALQGEIIVKMKAGTADEAGTKAGGSLSGNTQIDRVLMTAGTVSFERLFPECGKFEARTHAEGLDRWFVAKYDESLPAAEVASMLSGCDGIEKIEYSIPTAVSDYSRAEEAPESYVPETKASATARDIPFPFNESERARRMQWHYNNTGNVYANSTVAGADADVYAAWQLCTGNPDVIVAVIDQGVKYDHEDLNDNMWVNTGEIPGNGIDDDGNGYADDIYGYNFTSNKGELNFSSALMHGTHVAGTIAAVNNNGIGVNGIAGGSGKGDGVRIMSLETLGNSESGTSGGGLSAQVRAMKYAADNGAVVCQNSWGYTAGALSKNDWSRGNYSSLAEAIRYFIKYAGIDEKGEQTGPMAGGIVIFAAGNDASSELCYPASDPAVVSVAATSYLGTPAYYTNYGKWVTLSAPGGDLSLNSIYGGVYSTSVAEDGGSAYEGINGTSMACPHVSGACALAISWYYGDEKKKGLTPDMLRDALLASTRPVDPFCTAPYTGNMGAGSLDTYQFLLAVKKVGIIPDMEVNAGASATLALADYFFKTDVLVYTVSDESVINVSLRNGVMTIAGLKKGNAYVTVTDGNKFTRTFKVTVR